MPQAAAVVPPTQEELQQRVLEVVRALAEELGGARAARAAQADASLERDIGLGSLERVELLLRLEQALGRRLDERLSELDTPAELARALLDGGEAAAAPLPERAAPVAPAARRVEGARTLHESLWRQAEAGRGRPHVFMREDDGSERTESYGSLLAGAMSIACGLRERGIGRGDTVALMLPTGVDFLRSFQGILLARAVPVPIYPPVRLDRIEEYAARQSAILADAGVRALVTVTRARAIAALLRPGVPSLEHVVTPRELEGDGGPWPAPDGEPGDPAFIQYTSGSTGDPKGVLLTHANLLANIRAIGAALRVQPSDVGASWLPLYHDMGLIGSWLFCMHEGIPISIQSPLSFLSRPERWLWAIHTHRATLSAAPNFAYELCVRKVPDSVLDGLDLSSWRCALNGAEPVSPDTLERFARRFERCGFRREALLPVYGLAENSVAMSFPPPGRGPRVDSVARAPFERDGRAEAAAAGDASALRFVSVGSAVPEHEIRLVDDAGHDVPERSVGRLVFRGPSMTQGYYRKPEATAAIQLPGGWLDSGDLAYTADGELYIAGRRKDLIIKAGRNLVPQEIEEAAASVDGIRKGCVVAFGVADEAHGTESLVVVAETRVVEGVERDWLASALTERVAGALGLPPDRVALVPPGSIPKTSSGKVRRAATRDLYLRRELGRPPSTPLPTRLRLLAALLWSRAEPWLRELGRALYGAYLALTIALLALPLWAAVALLRSRRLAFGLGRVTARGILRLVGCRLSVSGLENLRGVGPCVFACNHASYADVPALMALLPLDFVFVAKKEVLGYPVVGTYVRNSGHLTVDRWDMKEGVADARRIAHALEAGESVLFFPEGTFTWAAGLRPFRLGAFNAAVQAGVPVVPLALRGTRHVLRGDHWFPRPGPIELWVGRPVHREGEGWRAVVALRDRVAAVIAEECGEPRLELVAGGPVRS
jgi:1-acyl-sn-glycerol-3-phosphate acyltransferase